MKRLPIHTHYDSFKKGCPQSFEVIHQYYHLRIYWIGRSIINDPFVVETLVQDTFLKLWIHRDKIETPEHIFFFLRMVIKRECYSYYTQPRNQFFRKVNSLEEYQNYSDYLAGYDPVKESEQLVDQDVQQHFFDQIKKVLPLLGSRKQHLIELCLEHGFSYKPIAARMGISIMEARITMQKTIAEIKTILNQGYILKTDETEEVQSQPLVEITEQQARVLELRCEQQYSFAAIAAELNLSQKEVHRAFTTAYKFLQENEEQHLKSA